MKRISGILDLAGHATLTLLDELGAGTDPAEGAALAVSILEQLRRQGSLLMACLLYTSVVWQIGEMGKLDLGGGGTVAKYVANQDIDTIDIGVPVLSMHSPFEIVSKADVYMPT